MDKNDILDSILRPKLDALHREVLRRNANITQEELLEAYRISLIDEASENNSSKFKIIRFLIAILFIVVILIPTSIYVVQFVLGVRCFVPNNYMIWEATRPISNCEYCKHINRPLILPNMTQEEFLPFAYSLQPIIMKNAIGHWPASTLLNYNYLKDLYNRHTEDLNSFEDECQFLNFKSNFLSLKELFEMPEERAAHGIEPWYVGFSNCQTKVLNELRKLYPIPHFLPSDSEIPNTDYIFLGYDQGAIMHLDYIPRLMWQAQLRGNKTWILAPTPECTTQCKEFSFYVEPGDAILLDTRIWYHGTFISPGEFSLTIQSEYG